MKWYQTDWPRLEQALCVAATALGWTLIYLGLLLPLWMPALDVTRLMLDGAVLLLVCQARQIRRLERIRSAVVNTFHVSPRDVTPSEVEAILEQIAKRARQRGTPCA